MISGTACDSITKLNRRDSIPIPFSIAIYTCRIYSLKNGNYCYICMYKIVYIYVCHCIHIVMNMIQALIITAVVLVSGKIILLLFIVEYRICLYSYSYNPHELII